MELTNKEILITGGTGSLGSTLVRKLKDYSVKGIRIYSRDEFKQWKLKNELEAERLLDTVPVSFLLGDIRDKERLNRATKGVDIIINTAAMKQVPACEYNPIEAIKTNIHGAENIIDCAIDNKISKVLHISTDKAVNPINLYGATKTVAEKLFTHANVYSTKTIFSCCRYGNVLASRGSIIPLIREQSKTGKVTLTHPEMSRFFISLSEVSSFIIQRLKDMEGKEIFIPMMPTIKITDLISILAPKAEIEIIGIRQGEKLHEILISAEESLLTETKDNYFIIKDKQINDKPWVYTSEANPWRLKTKNTILQKIEESKCL